MVNSKNNKDTAALRLIADINEQENVGFRASKDQQFWMFPIKLVSSDVSNKYTTLTQRKKKVTSGQTNKTSLRPCVIFTFFCCLIVNAEEKLCKAVKAMKISSWQCGELLGDFTGGERSVQSQSELSSLGHVCVGRRGDVAAPGLPQRMHPEGHLAGLHFRSVYLRRERISDHFMDGTLSAADSLSFITAEQWRQVGSWLISLYHFQK